MSLKEFLDSKPLYYDDIDYEFFPKIWSKYKSRFHTRAKVFHIIGTNGKGTTGKTIATYLANTGQKVGHYSSPYLHSWSDIWTTNDKYFDDKTQDKAHKFLQKLLSQSEIKSISRFEYSTLVAFKLFEDMDYIVLEAGLGGEKDATNVRAKDISIVTNIGLDHMKFLGDSIEQIATTKLNSMAKVVITGVQQYNEVYDIAKKIATKKGTKYHDIEVLTKEKKDSIENIFDKYPKFLIDNISLGLGALKLMDIDIDIKHIQNIKFPGRYERLADNIIADVGHNSLSAMAMVDYIPADTYLIYNCLADKDFKTSLSILKPKIKKIYIYHIEDKRAIDIQILTDGITALGIPWAMYDIDVIKNKNDFLVYGSFAVVRDFIKGQNWKQQI